MSLGFAERVSIFLLVRSTNDSPMLFFVPLLPRERSFKSKVFAVLFVQAVQDYIVDPDNPLLPDREMLASQRYFSSLPDTMLSLFMCIAGGASWEDVQAPLKAISTVYVFFFLFFVSFTYFAVSCLQ